MAGNYTAGTTDRRSPKPMPSWITGRYRRSTAPRTAIAGIIRAHSLDAELLRRTFSISGALASTGLAWPDRELLASTASRTNQCFY